jgi:hypothetical protein
MPQWFRLTDSGKWRSLNVLNQHIDPLENRLVGLLPTQIVIPSNLVKFNPHREATPVAAHSAHALRHQGIGEG